MEILNFEFMQNAILISILISIICGIMGTLIVVNNIVFLSGSIAHASYGGIGIAVFFGFSATIGGSVFAVLISLLISYALVYHKKRLDLIIGAMWSFGMAIGIILIDLKGGYNTNLISYLFGSVLATSSEDILYLAILSIVVILFNTLLYNKFVALSFDSNFANLKGINIMLYSSILMIFCAVCIIAAIKLVGLIMVMALFTIPVFIAEYFANSIAKTMLYSSLISAIGSVSGLFISYYLDLTPSAVIIVLLVLFYFLKLVYDATFSFNKK